MIRIVVAALLAAIAASALAQPMAFRDCPECPEMVMLPGGRFAMGSAESEPEHKAWEGPRREVFVTAFALGRTEVTFAEWDACHAAGGCAHRPDDYGHGRGQRPVIDVSWRDAKQYAVWLARRTGQPYRLPSEAEWEYAARAGSGLGFGCGAEATCLDRIAWHKTNAEGRAQPVGRLAANAFGLHDMLGNVWEWTEDCWNGDHARGPGDGAPRLAGDCGRRVTRGGSWAHAAGTARPAARFGSIVTNRYDFTGFRVARDKWSNPAAGG
ncbi:MAG: formylglycine-generating enzyme family protein [Alphaproteobacteria bacterium]|nr:formylglycine-generating enzyme family protein [Alphaproteobacteria bacterium]